MAATPRSVGNCPTCDLEVLVTARGTTFRHQPAGFSLTGNDCAGSRKAAVNVRPEPRQPAKRAPKPAARTRRGAADFAESVADAVVSVIDAFT